MLGIAWKLGGVLEKHGYRSWETWDATSQDNNSKLDFMRELYNVLVLRSYEMIQMIQYTSVN